MRVPRDEFRSLGLEVHGILSDVPLHDVSAIGGVQGMVYNPPYFADLAFTSDNITPQWTLQTGFPAVTPPNPATYSGNVFLTANNGGAGEDAAPEMEANTIHGSLKCSGNSPMPKNAGGPAALSTRMRPSAGGSSAIVARSMSRLCASARRR